MDMRPELVNEVAVLVGKINGKSQELTQYHEEVSWKMFQGEASGAFGSDFDDSSWESMRLRSIDLWTPRRFSPLNTGLNFGMLT
jgi:hypothetical protein